LAALSFPKPQQTLLRLPCAPGFPYGFVAVSSNKSMIEHTLSAAGAVEAIFSPLTLEHQQKSADLRLRHSGSRNSVRRRTQQVAGCAGDGGSFGFGGQDASTIMTREPA